MGAGRRAARHRPTQTPLLEAGLNDPRYGQATRNFVPPLGRRAEPDGIAAVVAFLLSAQAGYVHGAQIVVGSGIDATTRPKQFRGSSAPFELRFAPGDEGLHTLLLVARGEQQLVGFAFQHQCGVERGVHAGEYDFLDLHGG